MYYLYKTLIFLPYIKHYSKASLNKTKMTGKNGKCLVYLRELGSYINYMQAISV